MANRSKRAELPSMDVIQQKFSSQKLLISTDQAIILNDFVHEILSGLDWPTGVGIANTWHSTIQRNRKNGHKGIIKKLEREYDKIVDLIIADKAVAATAKMHNLRLYKQRSMLRI